MSRLLLHLLAALAGWYFAAKKGWNGLLPGIVCGLVPPLLILVVFLPNKWNEKNSQPCPYCAKRMPLGAVVCGHCRRALPVDLVRCGRCGAYVPSAASCSGCSAPLKTG